MEGGSRSASGQHHDDAYLSQTPFKRSGIYQGSHTPEMSYQPFSSSDGAHPQPLYAGAQDDDGQQHHHHYSSSPLNSSHGKSASISHSPSQQQPLHQRTASVTRSKNSSPVTASVSNQQISPDQARHHHPSQLNSSFNGGSVNGQSQSQWQQQQQQQQQQPNNNFYRHQQVPSLSSGVPPVTSKIRRSSTSVHGQAAQYHHTTSSSSSRRLPLHDTPAAWMFYYFLANLSLTLYNKLLMNKFPFPWALTGIHTLCGALGAQTALQRGFFTQQRLNTRENLVLVAFSSLYTINIAVSNLSLNLVTVPFHQVVRAMTPLFTVVLAAIFLRKRSSRATYISLIPVVMGVVFATYGDYYFTTWGLILTLLGTLLAAMKTIVTNMILVGRLKLHPLDLLLRMSPLAFIQCVFASWWTGELSRVREFGATEMTRGKLLGLIVNGAIAFFLNVVSFTANKKTSALSMTVAANVKQVLTIILAVVIFHLHITPMNLFGITLTLFGGAAYAKVELDAKAARDKNPTSPLVSVKEDKRVVEKS